MCAETIRLASEIGLAGGSIEDASGDSQNPIYDFDLAVKRVAAAAKAAHDCQFVLTARAENFLHDRADLDDTVRRLQSFAARWRRCPLRARSAESRCNSQSVRVRLETGECVDGPEGCHVFRGRARCGRCETHQRWRFIRPRSSGRIRPSRARSEREGNFHLRRRCNLSRRRHQLHAGREAHVVVPQIQFELILAISSAYVRLIRREFARAIQAS